MTDLASWDQRNEDYLAASVARTRLLLEQAVARQRPAERQVITSPEPPRRWLFRTPDERPALATASEVPVPEVEAAVEPPPALVLLGDRFSLTPFERNVLLLCVAIELQPGLAALCGDAQGDPRLSYPTFALAFTLFDDPTWEPLLPDRPLRRYQLVEVHQPQPTVLTAAALRAGERTVAFAKGISYLDDRLALLLTRPPDESDGEPGSVVAVVDRMLAEVNAVRPGYEPVVALLGAESTSKLLVAQAACRRLELTLYQLPSALLPADPGELELLARRWERESMLSPVALYLTGAGPALDRLVARTSGTVFVDTHDVPSAPGRTVVVSEVVGPSTAEQEAVWCTELDTEGQAAAPGLANQFHLPTPTIRRIAQTARRGVGGSVADRAWSMCLAETRRGMDALAERVESSAGWDDIVLPDRELRLLRTLADQVAQRRQVYETWGFGAKSSRGLGINALFTGPPGCGKTMMAAVIANHLRLSLYCIDLSKIVDKYIGETEKNLARVFDQAEHRGVVLFFDECDALFGKRTEVRDSHDRYANIESSYLLQRLEAFGGLAILATNMKSALDPAFIRRLRCVVDFPSPGPRERTQIWRRAFPAEAETDGIDAERLGRLNFTGGNIVTIAVNAAFLAAAQGVPIGMPHVLDAARTEAHKLERPFSERDFELLAVGG
ncbi:ATP-binding protein [Actinomycetospora chibensis]|uniref:ATP-binding protein n=1 Tax=Actinomycetospora chibensis TaxID=663606 RepID=A0ABV9RNY7_9PSEU|nr:AAA family ATPase [Actinomycetospora chibensis]MDD7926967.1 AAA family ATPase [Actinomycetospora chibensis]